MWHMAPRDAFLTVVDHDLRELLGAMIQPATEALPRKVAESLNVLVVDDDEDARTIVEKLTVRALGHRAAVACDGVEVFEMHMLDRAEIILSDWTMPRMNGLELCLKVRASDPAPLHTHFIFFTGNNDEAHSQEGMRAGADDHLFKPIDIVQLEARFAAAGRVLSLHREQARRSREHDPVEVNLLPGPCVWRGLLHRLPSLDLPIERPAIDAEQLRARAHVLLSPRMLSARLT